MSTKQIDVAYRDVVSGRIFVTRESADQLVNVVFRQAHVMLYASQLKIMPTLV